MIEETGVRHHLRTIETRLPADTVNRRTPDRFETPLETVLHDMHLLMQGVVLPEINQGDLGMLPINEHPKCLLIVAHPHNKILHLPWDLQFCQRSMPQSASSFVVIRSRQEHINGA